jgi:peptidoglycan glycosyltransferase
MTLRGRLTAAAVVGLCALAAGLAGSRAGQAVGTEPAPVAAAPRAAPAAPPELVQRLPGGGELRALLEEAGEGGPPQLAELWPTQSGRRDLVAPLYVQYSFDPELTRAVLRVLRRGRVRRGHVIVLDPASGRVLAYASTDADAFPPQRAYPAASLVKIVTATAALQHAPKAARMPCTYRGSAWRLHRWQLVAPSSGREISLQRALSTSNNQCFARLAVNAVGRETLLDTLARFGWLEAPAPGHQAGRVAPGDDEWHLGLLGCGLSGCRITPLHAAQLAATLRRGERVEPWWVERVTDGSGRELRLPEREPPRRVMSPELATELRRMLVHTTTEGTARRAFRDRRGRPRLGAVRVAGKTGNLSGSDPDGRYEWFIGVAPADDPKLAIAVVQLQDDLWWRSSSQLAADVLVEIFCEKGACRPELAARFTAQADRRSARSEPKANVGGPPTGRPRAPIAVAVDSAS